MLPQAKPPLKLQEMQKWFGKIISSKIENIGTYGLPVVNKGHSKKVREYISFGKVLTPEQRIAIYQHQYWLRLIRVLKNQFPFLVRLFGEENFSREMAVSYFLQFPPDTWSLNKAGYQLEHWIKNFYEGEDKEVVYWAAKIDFAYTQIYWAGNFAKLKGVHNLTKKIYLQPFVELFMLEADFFTFRKKLVHKSISYWLDHDFPKLNWNKTYFFVLFRYQHRLFYEKISETEFFLLKEFQKGSTLEKVVGLLEKKKDKQIEKKLIEWFQNWSKLGWLGQK